MGRRRTRQEAITASATGKPCSRSLCAKSTLRMLLEQAMPTSISTPISDMTFSEVCVNGMTVVSGAQQGVCCKNSAVCAANACNSNVIDTCTGAAIPCVCNGAQFCNGANTCVAKNTCASLGKTGAIGSGCNDAKFYDDGSGVAANKIACPCAPQNGFTNILCGGESATVEGVCACSASACVNCSQNGQSNGCGGTKSCACAGPMVCFPAAGGPNGCCTQKTCAALPAGVPAGACGTFNDGCGSSFPCGCPTTNMTTGLMMANEQCVPVGGASPAYGACSCTPTPCTVLGVGTHVNDGCGNPVNCGA